MMSNEELIIRLEEMHYEKLDRINLQASSTRGLMWVFFFAYLIVQLSQ